MQAKKNSELGSSSDWDTGFARDGEPMDPNEIRLALSELRELMSRIRSSVISRDLRTAYDRIAGITVREWLPH